MGIFLGSFVREQSEYFFLRELFLAASRLFNRHAPAPEWGHGRSDYFDVERTDRTGHESRGCHGFDVF